MTSKYIDFNYKFVYHLVSLIPKGKSLNFYGEAAKILSLQSPRFVGRILPDFCKI